MEPLSVNVTESAYKKLTKIVSEEENPNTSLRIFVQGGGCSGFQYGFSLDTNQAEDDFVIEGKVKILIDALSYQYINGSVIDYEESLMNSQFTIKNPNVQSTCGCGSSFSV